MEWRTIETAPLDKAILVWDQRFYIAFFLNQFIEAEFGKVIHPTHWIPLPPPPTVNESLTVPTDDELYAIQEEDAYAAAEAEAYSAAKSEAYAAKARLAMDNDLDEPLGKACSMDNPECESCQ